VFFVMALPAVWRASARDPRGDTLATVVFMHEFTHTQGGEIAGRIDSLMRAGLPADADDDVIQTRFENRPGFRAAYERERDLLFRAATASSLAEARRLAIQAVEEMDRRRGTFFTGGDSVYAPTEDVFLTLEGMGQWAAYLWLTDSLGGGMGVGDALAFVRRGREHWSQDEGLAIALVLSRFQPGWAPRTVRGTDGMLALLHQGLGMPRRGATKRRD
jgi:hypothetical protein